MGLRRGAVLGLRRADVRDDPVYRARSLLVVRHLPQHGHPPRIEPRLTVGVSIIPFCIRSASSLIFLRSLSFCFGDRLRYSLNTACVFFFIDCAPHQLPRTLNGAYLPQQGHPPCTGPRLTVLLSIMFGLDMPIWVRPVKFGRAIARAKWAFHGRVRSGGPGGGGCECARDPICLSRHWRTRASS